MAAQDPSDAEPRSSDRAVAFHRFEGVARARRYETTLREHQVRQRRLVEANERHEGAPWPEAGGLAMRVTPAGHSARSSTNDAAYPARFARPPRTTPGGEGTGGRLWNPLKRRGTP